MALEKRKPEEIKVSVDRVVEKSKEIGRPLTTDEACEILEIKKKHLGGRIQRYPILEQHIAREFHAKTVRDFLPQIQTVIAKINAEKLKAPTAEAVAEELHVDAGKLLTWLRNNTGGTMAVKNPVLMPSELKQVLYLSLADIYYRNGIRFTPEMLATTLGENPRTLRAYLSKATSHSLREYLDTHGLQWYAPNDDH